jgi:hypothetical protein
MALVIRLSVEFLLEVAQLLGPSVGPISAA